MTKAISRRGVVLTGLGGGVLALAFLIRAPAGAEPVAGRPLPFDPTARKAPNLADAGGGVSGGRGIGCNHQNFQKSLVDRFIASQKDPNFPFWIETADDFVFFDPADPNGTNGCVLDSVVTGFRFFNCGDVDGDGDSDQDDCVALGVNPADCWTGIKITIYEDISAGVPDTGDPGCKLPKQPAGYPAQGGPPREHVDCFIAGGPPGIVCELKVPMSKVTVTANPALSPTAWDVNVSGLKQFNCLLQKNHKYWIAVSPEQDAATCAQTGIYVHPGVIDHQARVYFPFGAPPFQWRPLSAVIPDGIPRDVAIDVFANKDVEQCTFFLDKGAFEMFNISEGKLLKGIEDFEESNVPAGGGAFLAAPLEGNVPNVDTAGLGFPEGLAQKNIRIQDNIFPGPNPPDPMPSGKADAIFVIGVDAAASNSEKVGENLWMVNTNASLDLIFTEPNHTGVGFELSCLPGVPNAGWDITVYDKADDEMGKFFVPPGPAEPSKTFFGVWCDRTIGRINVFYIFGPAPDTIDNIQMWEETPQQCTVFLDQGAFEMFNLGEGKVLKGIEDFEESNVPAGSEAFLTAPLEGNVPNVNPLGVGFPDGLTQKNIIIQDNIFPGLNPPDPMPSGLAGALFVVGDGFRGSNSEKIGENVFGPFPFASLDLIFTEPNHTGVGFDLSCLNNANNGGWHITIYDKNDDEMGKSFVPSGPSEPSKTFFGVWCDRTIGRINIRNLIPTPDLVDNIQMWQEVPPCPWDCAAVNDGIVSVIDLLALLAQWDVTNPPCDGRGTCDFDSSGCVDVADLLKFLAHFDPAGLGCP